MSIRGLLLRLGGHLGRNGDISYDIHSSITVHMPIHCHLNSREAVHQTDYQDVWKKYLSTSKTKKIAQNILAWENGNMYLLLVGPGCYPVGRTHLTLDFGPRLESEGSSVVAT